jgi:hypothetical protein
MVLPDIADPKTGRGWQIVRADEHAAMHTEVLRELCDRAQLLHLGTPGEGGVAAVLQLVDLMQQELVLVSPADGPALARLMKARPLWAAAHLRSLHVQFPLVAASASREGAGGPTPPGRGERFILRARWPYEIHRRTKPRADGTTGAAQAGRGPVARFHSGHLLVSTDDYALGDLSESGATVWLPAGRRPPRPGARLERIELELDDDHIVFTDAVVHEVTAQPRGRHAVACRFDYMHAGAQHTLRRWLALGDVAGEAAGDAAHDAAYEGRASMQPSESSAA